MSKDRVGPPELGIIGSMLGYSPLGKVVAKLTGGMKFPQLFGLVLVLFLADVVIPDIIPFVDEILLALATILLGSLRTKTEQPDPQARTIDVQAQGSNPED